MKKLLTVLVVFCLFMGFAAGFVTAARSVSDELPDTTKCAKEGGCYWMSTKELSQLYEMAKHEVANPRSADRT